MPDPDPEPAHKSSHSNLNGSCVLVSTVASLHTARRMISLRDSKNPDGSRLEFTPDEWRASIKGAKDCEFDLDADDRLPLTSAVKGEPYE